MKTEYRIYHEADGNWYIEEWLIGGVAFPEGRVIYAQYGKDLIAVMKKVIPEFARIQNKLSDLFIDFAG